MHPNHEPEFYRLLKTLMPNWQKRKKTPGMDDDIRVIDLYENVVGSPPADKKRSQPIGGLQLFKPSESVMERGRRKQRIRKKNKKSKGKAKIAPILINARQYFFSS